MIRLDEVEGNNSLGDEDTELVVSRDGRTVELVVLAGEGGHVVAEQRVDDGHRLGIVIDSAPRGVELDSEPLVLSFVPASAQADVEPAFRDVVDRHRLLSQQGRVAKGVRGHEDADSHA